MGCNCGSRKKSSTTRWQHVSSDGKVIAVYSSEMDARLAASRQAGSRVRAA